MDWEKYERGDVFQISPSHKRKGWIGAFVMATEVKSWGMQGFVAYVEEHEKQSKAYIRLLWSEVEYVGHAPFTPADE